MLNWSLGVTESRAMSQADQRIVIDIEKSLKDARKPVEKATRSLTQEERLPKRGVKN